LTKIQIFGIIPSEQQVILKIMANISYTATGRKNSKKNPAIMVLTITTDNGESVQVKMEYTKKNSWTPAAETSERAVCLFCEFITLDAMWNNKSLQNYINGYFNNATSWNKQAASLKWMEHYAAWKYNENKDGKVIIWSVQK
jgi:hypothetical protein